MITVRILSDSAYYVSSALLSMNIQIGVVILFVLTVSREASIPSGVFIVLSGKMKLVIPTHRTELSFREVKIIFPLHP